jgi:cell division protein FtsB
MGWIKAVGNWIFGHLGNFPTAAAQKEKYETKIMLLEAEHKKAIDVLEAENRDLRAKIEPLTQENKQLHASENSRVTGPQHHSRTFSKRACVFQRVF